MDFQFILIMFLFAIFVFIMIIFLVRGLINFAKGFWSIFDHAKISKSAILREDAKIVNVRSEKVQYVKNGMKYKTTVTFSDGFTFITHETDRDDHFLSYNISISPELQEWIIRAATDAHEDAFEKQQRRLNKSK